ncbi:MAG: CoA-binding domain protein [Frankiales bacterium]|nr:CoA-binding domain protein [Frankiales bacterium]
MSTAVTPINDLVLDVLLRDSVIASIRALRADDEDALAALNARVSLRTRMLRYFSVSDQPGKWYVDKLVRSERGDGALVASVGGQIVGLAGFCRLERDPDTADLALLIDDEHQAEGLGALLLEHLAARARHQGITTFVADVLIENSAMLHLLRDSGFAVQTTSSAGVSVLLIDLTEGPVLWDAVRRRDNSAQRTSLGPVLSPRSVAVVGSTRPGSVAEHVRHALLGFTGTVVLVDKDNPLTRPVDLLIVVVAADKVLGVAHDAAAAGVKGLVVLSAGFAEEGPAGALRQAELVALCRRSGMRLVGPNCLGILNTDRDVRLNATFCDADPREGRVALVSQSGAVGVAALRHAERSGVGLSLFVSTGNKADVSGNDLLAYLQDDPRTSVIGLYLESFGNAQKFTRVAAAVGRTKPVVVLKAGSTAAGAKAGMSHTAAAATPALAIAAIFHEAGVIQAQDLPEMFDLLSVLASAPLPQGPRVAVIGNSGGPGVLAADASTGAGLVMAEFSTATRAALSGLLPSSAAVDNPVDLLATVTAETYAEALRAVLADPGVDAVLAIYTPVTGGAEAPFASVLAAAAAANPSTPVLAVFPGVGMAPAGLLGPTGDVALPFFEFAEPAVRALGKVAAYAAWRTLEPAPRSYVLHPKRRDRARALLDIESGWLSPVTTTGVLEAYGIPTARTIAAVDASTAAAAADALGYPVALKAAGTAIVHKTDVGGVALGLQTAAEVRAAFAGMRKRIGPTMTSAVVQRMHPAEGALELLVGLTVDPGVGPLLLVAEGGTYTDLLDDRVVRMPPANREAAWEQLASLRCARRFGGYRGGPALAVEGVVDVLMSLAAMALELPALLELDLNPLLVTPSSVSVLDARIRVGPPIPVQDRGTRSLSRAAVR